MAQINKIILNSNKHFSEAYLQRIDRAFAEAFRLTRKLLRELPNIDIVFYHNPKMVISDIGIGGNTENANTIIIPLDAGFNISQKELMLTICHELHHAVRMNKLGETDSLPKKIVSEGLADQFELEFHADHQPITYRKDISQKDIQNGLKDLIKIMKTGEYDYYEWFFGSGSYPNWFGYTVGNYVIEEYCKRYSTKPSKLVFQPAEDFTTFIQELANK